MRYNTPIYFQKVIPGEYNPDTGNYSDDTVEETLRYASVMDTGTDMLNLVYGTVRQGSLTIQLQNHYNDSFDNIRIKENQYRVDFSRKLQTKQIFVVSEVQ